MSEDQRCGLDDDCREILRETPLPASTKEGVERLKARGKRLYPGVYGDVEEVLAELIAEWHSLQERVAKRGGYKSWRSLSRISEQRLRAIPTSDPSEQEVVATELRRRQQQCFLDKETQCLLEKRTSEAWDRLEMIERRLTQHARELTELCQRDRSTDEQVLAVAAAMEDIQSSLVEQADCLINAKSTGGEFTCSTADERFDFDTRVAGALTRAEALCEDTEKLLSWSEVETAIIEIVTGLLKSEHVNDCVIKFDARKNKFLLVTSSQITDVHKFRNRTIQKHPLLLRYSFVCKKAQAIEAKRRGRSRRRDRPAS